MKKIYPFLFLMAPVFANDDLVKDKLKDFGISNIEITESPVAGLKTIISDQGIIYVSEDGRHFIQGSLIELDEKGNARDISKKPLMGKLEALASEMIVYPAKEEKHILNVFFDVTCHYCQVLHKDIPELNKKGITVRYLAFPRQGLTSKNARQMETIFNAENRQEALKNYDSGKSVSETRVDKVAKHYQLGVMFGVEGTPALVTSDGELIGGYMKPDVLLNHLEK